MCHTFLIKVLSKNDSKIPQHDKGYIATYKESKVSIILNGENIKAIKILLNGDKIVLCSITCFFSVQHLKC